MTLLAALLLLAAEAAPPAVTPASAVAPSTAIQRAGAPAALPPVTAQLFHVGGSFELQPMFAFSVGDPFWRTVSAGLRVEHHFDERWSIAGHVLGGVSMVAAPIAVCGGTACDAPAAAQLRSTPGQLQLLTGAEVGWAPVYGKVSLFGERTLHFDAYVALGPELVRELIAPDAASPQSGRWAMGGRVSVGERVFISDRLMVRVAASELVYAGRVRGQAEVERQLGFEGGVAWLFGAGR